MSDDEGRPDMKYPPLLLFRAMLLDHTCLWRLSAHIVWEPA